jgi:type II secretion system protein I
MAKKIKDIFNIKSTQDGFTLMEILIAITVFAVFVASYMVAQGFNLTDSMVLKEEMILKRLCENKINELIINPPELNSGATLSPQTKNFEDYPDYAYTVEIKQMKIPDLSKLVESGEEGDNASGMSASEKRVLNKVGEALQEMVWQLKVTVAKKEDNFNYTLSTWLYKKDARIDFSSF